MLTGLKHPRVRFLVSNRFRVYTASTGIDYSTARVIGALQIWFRADQEQSMSTQCQSATRQALLFVPHCTPQQRLAAPTKAQFFFGAPMSVRSSSMPTR